MKRARKRRRRSFLIPVIGMGDIAFLLIIFFLLCGHFAKEPVTVTPARSEDIASLANPRSLVIVDDTGAVYFDGRPVGDPAGLEGALAEAGKLDEATAEARHIQLKVDAAVSPTIYKPVLEALAKSGATIEFIGELAPPGDSP